MHRASFFSHPQNLDFRQSASLRENFTGQVPSLSRVLVGGTGRDIPRRSRPVPGFSNNLKELTGLETLTCNLS